jgi:phosphotransferase system enzyme I (PtsP)
MASDPLSAVLLLGMGVNDFSLSAPAIPVVKSALRKISLANARSVADHVLTLESASSIRAYLEIVRAELHL